MHTPTYWGNCLLPIVEALCVTLVEAWTPEKTFNPIIGGTHWGSYLRALKVSGALLENLDLTELLKISTLAFLYYLCI